MGRVIQAFDRQLQRTVAVKRIKGTLATDPDLLRRFLREAQFAARLNHPSVVTVHDILADDEGPYLVLEFIDGESLAQRIERGAIPWKEAIQLLLPICNAVHFGHKRGIIHRDIKPANIMLPSQGDPKLSDFGIANSLEGTDLTQTRSAMGSLAYGAPEQFQSARTVDARSDVYSLAATLYHMVTGEIPQPISADELPVELREVVLKGMQRIPEKRHSAVSEFAKELARIWKGQNPSSVASNVATDQKTFTSAANTSDTNLAKPSHIAKLTAAEIPLPTLRVTQSVLTLYSCKTFFKRVELSLSTDTLTIRHPDGKPTWVTRGRIGGATAENTSLAQVSFASVSLYHALTNQILRDNIRDIWSPLLVLLGALFLLCDAIANGTMALLLGHSSVVLTYRDGRSVVVDAVLTREVADKVADQINLGDRER